MLLPDLVQYYNNLYQPSLGCRSPNEVLRGEVPVVLGLAEAKLVRRLENKLECCF